MAPLKVTPPPLGKVLHLPTTVGGNPQGLSYHLQKLGVDSVTLTVHQNYFGYPADYVITQKNDSLLWMELKKLWALSYVFRYQVIFFNYGSTLFNPIPATHDGNKRWRKFFRRLYFAYNKAIQKIELALLRLLGRKLFIQYQGDDARQGDYCLSNFEITTATQVEKTYYTAEKDVFKRRQIASLTSICSKTYALNPDLLHVLPKTTEFLPYSHISLDEWLPHYTQLEDRPLRIGHAPSHRGVKGTELVLKAIEELKNEGYDFDFVLIEGLSNAVAKERYKTIDVLVDQLYAGWYGGLAVEAMALGKPVIAYIREGDLHLIPPKMRQDLPVVRAEPNSIRKVLEGILSMERPALLDLAKRSRRFVEVWHDPLAIANRIKTDMETALGQR